jgi:tetratricopeptide (TPR) repeat protein
MTSTRVLAISLFLAGLAACGPIRPATAGDYLVSGQFRLQQGDVSGALADVDRACALDPGLAAAHLLRGRVLSRKGDVDGAIAAYSRAIEINPSSAVAWNNRAANRNKKKDYDGALADVGRALDLHPRFAVAYNTRGYSHQQLGHSDLALRDYERALELDPKLPEAAHNLAELRLKSGDLEGAIRDCERFIDANPRLPTGYEIRGVVRYNRREWIAALSDFRSACDRSVTQACFPRLYIWLILARLGKTGEADIELKTALDADGPHPEEDAYRQWYRRAGSFLLGGIDEASFLGEVDVDSEQRTRWIKSQAAFYAGTKRLAAGDRVTATRYFRIASENSSEGTFEATSAAAEMRALDAQLPTRGNR